MENTLFPLTEHFVPSYKNKVFFSAESVDCFGIIVLINIVT